MTEPLSTELTNKEKITRYLRRDGGWVPGWALGGLTTEDGKIGVSGSRRARELADEGRIAVRYTLAPIMTKRGKVRKPFVFYGDLSLKERDDDAPSQPALL